MHSTQQDRAPAVEVPDRPSSIPIRSQGTDPTSTSCARVVQTAPAVFPTSLYVAQELPKRPWPGTGLPWGISGPPGPLNRRLGLFGCSSAAESGHVAPQGSPDQSQKGTASRPDSTGASWPGCLFAHPALPAVRLSLSPFRNRHLVSKLSDSDLAVLDTHTRKTQLGFFGTRLGFGVSSVASLC